VEGIFVQRDIIASGAVSHFTSRFSDLFRHEADPQALYSSGRQEPDALAVVAQGEHQDRDHDRAGGSQPA